MSVSGEDSALYVVSYSIAVRQRLKILAETARARGDGEEFLAALREFDRRLQLYPQFGDPLVDLVAEIGQVRLGAVPPLAMRYGVIEGRRLVLVASPSSFAKAHFRLITRQTHTSIVRVSCWSPRHTSA